MSVTGIDGKDLAEEVEPGLTTVEQPLEVMGRIAGTILLERLRGEHTEAGWHGRLLLGSFRVRASTASVAHLRK